MTDIETWKLALRCTRAEAEALPHALDAFDDLDPPPVIVVNEPDAATPDRWTLDAYFEGKPQRSVLRRVAALAPSARVRDPRAKPLPPQDWISASQAGFVPLVAGRFCVRTPDQAAPHDLVAPPLIELVIPAGLAFGTGQHATTAGCLAALDALRRSGKRYRSVLDIGTGTGLLAFAAARLWPMARVTASDIDPVAVAVARENAALNAVPGISFVVADATDDARIIARAPYDLVIANVLAQPLIDMAAPVAATLAAGGTLLLAGLLDTQVSAVARAYRRHGLRLAAVGPGEWPVLRMIAR